MARNRASTLACMIGKVGADKAKQFKQQELDEVIERLEGIEDAASAIDGNKSPAQAVLTAAQVVRKRQLEAFAIEKRNAAQRATVYLDLLRHVEQFSAAKKGSAGSKAAAVAPGKAGGVKDYWALATTFYGSNKLADFGRNSFDAMKSSRFNQFIGDMFRDIEKAGLTEKLLGRKVAGVFRLGAGVMDDDIYAELWELGLKKGQLGKTGNKEALEAAKIFRKYLDLSRVTQNKHGAYIKDLMGYVGYQASIPHKLQKAGFDRWKDRILNEYRLDLRRTFGDAFMARATREDIDNALREGFDHQVTGVDKANDDIKVGVGINIAKKASQSRVWHFSDAKGWAGYANEFGHGSLMDNIRYTLERGARNAALLERFSDNPESVINKVRAELQRRNAGDAKAVQLFKSKRLDNLLAAATGAVDAIDSPMFAITMNVMRVNQAVAHLGNMLFASVPDLGTQAAALQFNGQNFFQSLGEQAGHIVGGDKETADMLSFSMRAMIADLQSQLQGNETLPGLMGKIQQLYFKANLTTAWDDRRSRGMVTGLAYGLWKNKGKTFSAINGDLRKQLATYGIFDKEWDIYRTYGAEATNSGEGGVLLGEAMRHLPDDVVRGYLGKQNASRIEIGRAKDKLERTLRSYYSDQLDWALLQPGTREKVQTTGGFQRGTAGGEIYRSFFQFKVYPLQMYQRVLGRFAEEDGHFSIAKGLVNMPRSNMVRLSQLMVSMWGMGYLAMTLKDLAIGREPRDPTDPRTLMTAFVQGGGLGLYGDFLFGTQNRYGQSLVGTIGGPLVGDVEEAGEIMIALRNAPFSERPGRDAESAIERVYKLGKGNTPFIGMFYSRAALDYLIFHRMQEMMAPGSLKRMERRLKDERNQEYFIPPSEAVR